MVFRNLLYPISGFSMSYLFDNFGVKVRRIDANNYVEVMWALGCLWIQQVVNGTGSYIAMPVTSNFVEFKGIGIWNLRDTILNYVVMRDS